MVALYAPATANYTTQIFVKYILGSSIPGYVGTGTGQYMCVCQAFPAASGCRIITLLALTAVCSCEIASDIASVLFKCVVYRDAWPDARQHRRQGRASALLLQRGSWGTPG